MRAAHRATVYLPDMRLSEIWSYPVKSMLGSTVASALLATDGIQGDRKWTLRSDPSGALRGGKKLRDVMRCSAALDAENPDRARITLPDGSTVLSDAADVHQRLSAALGEPLRLAGRPTPGTAPRTREIGRAHV